MFGICSCKLPVALVQIFPAVGEMRQCNRNMSKSKGWTLQSSLLTLWMDENSNQQSNKNG